MYISFTIDSLQFLLRVLIRDTGLGEHTAANPNLSQNFPNKNENVYSSLFSDVYYFTRILHKFWENIPDICAVSMFASVIVIAPQWAWIWYVLGTDFYSATLCWVQYICYARGGQTTARQSILCGPWTRRRSSNRLLICWSFIWIFVWSIIFALKKLCCQIFVTIRFHIHMWTSFFLPENKKSKNRSMLTDCNLNAVMRITTSELVPQFKNIIQNCEQLHSSNWF